MELAASGNTRLRNHRPGVVAPITQLGRRALAGLDFLSPVVELGVRLLVARGLGTRAAVVALFLFSLVAVVSYPDLSDVGLKDHPYWGLLMLITIVHDRGKLSLDHLLRRLHFM